MCVAQEEIECHSVRTRILVHGFAILSYFEALEDRAVKKLDPKQIPGHCRQHQSNEAASLDGESDLDLSLEYFICRS